MYNYEKTAGGVHLSFGPELIWSWQRELSLFVGSRVQKVEGTGDSLLLGLSGGSDLFLSWGAQNCGAAMLSARERKAVAASSSQIPPITNAVKSHIGGAELVAVSQLRRDRILDFSFHKTIGAGFVVERHLILEIMERFSNLILSDADGRVIETAKHIHPADNSFRSVLPGLEYKLPPSFDGYTLEEWLASPSLEDIMRITGVGRRLLGLLSSGTLEEAVAALKGLYDNSFSGVLIPQKIGNYITALPIIVRDAVKLENTNTGEVVALAPLHGASLESLRKRITKHIEKEILRRERQIADIKALLSDERPALYKMYGELIVANMWSIKHGSSSADLESYGSNGEKLSVKVPLQPELSPSQNSAAYFTKYKKISAAQERASSLLERVSAELADYQEELALAASLEGQQELEQMEDELGMVKKRQTHGRKKKEEKVPPCRRFEFGNALVYAGLSSKGNRYVTFRLAVADDIWFHAQGVPGAHVILRLTSQCNDGGFQRLLEFCASLAVFYSKAKNSPRHRVDYTRRKYVSPIRGGEANVIYKEFSTITGDPSWWSSFTETSV